jgi:hypothetical protein
MACFSAEMANHAVAFRRGSFETGSFSCRLEELSSSIPAKSRNPEVFFRKFMDKERKSIPKQICKSDFLPCAKKLSFASPNASA